MSDKRLVEYVRPQPATNLRENYEVTTTLLGEGCFCKVFNAISLRDRREYAAKVVMAAANDALTVERVHQEIDTALLCCAHAHIIILYEYFREHLRLEELECTKFTLILEKLAGGSLQQHALMRKPQTTAVGAELLRQLCSALAYMHARGIAHGDIRTANVLCVSVNALSPVKLADFHRSSARYVQDLANRMVDDIFELGVLAYNVLLLQSPPRDTRLGKAFECADFRQLAASAQQFLRALLNADKFARPTAQQALALPFLTSSHAAHE